MLAVFVVISKEETFLSLLMDEVGDVHCFGVEVEHEELSLTVGLPCHVTHDEAHRLEK